MMMGELYTINLCCFSDIQPSSPRSPSPPPQPTPPSPVGIVTLTAPERVGSDFNGPVREWLKKGLRLSSESVSKLEPFLKKVEAESPAAFAKYLLDPEFAGLLKEAEGLLPVTKRRELAPLLKEEVGAVTLCGTWCPFINI